MSDNFSSQINNLSQLQYEFNSTALNEEELKRIKLDAKNYRSSFGTVAPIGKNIFSMMEQCGDIVFILQKFENSELDAMIIRHREDSQKKYIVINSYKPLINQIFAAAHEYYHYLFSFQNQTKTQIICKFNNKDNEEIKANRFAAELLLPPEALKNETVEFLKYSGSVKLELLEIAKQVLFLFFITIKYSVPLKAVMYRLSEEGYYKDIDFLIANYNVIKKAFIEVWGKNDNVKELYSNSNPYISKPIDNLLPLLYEKGRLDQTEFLKLAETFNLDKTKIKEIVNKDEEGTLSDSN